MRYTIVWQRVGEADRLTCSGLNLRTLVARLISAVRNNPAGIVVRDIWVDR